MPALRVVTNNGDLITRLHVDSDWDDEIETFEHVTVYVRDEV